MIRSESGFEVVREDGHSSVPPVVVRMENKLSKPLAKSAARDICANGETPSWDAFALFLHALRKRPKRAAEEHSDDEEAQQMADVRHGGTSVARGSSVREIGSIGSRFGIASFRFVTLAVAPPLGGAVRIDRDRAAREVASYFLGRPTERVRFVRVATPSVAAADAGEASAIIAHRAPETIPRISVSHRIWKPLVPQERVAMCSAPSNIGSHALLRHSIASESNFDRRRCRRPCPCLCLSKSSAGGNPRGGGCGHERNPG